MPHIQSNTTNPRRLFDTTIFPVVSIVDLKAGRHLRKKRLGLDLVDRPVNNPIAAAISRDGRLLYVVNSGSDDLSVVDLKRRRAVAHMALGSNPRGIVLSKDGRTAYVSNHVSNDVSVLDLKSHRTKTTIRVTQDPRSDAIKEGQKIFYTAARTEITKDRWISCASCHFDGGQDGRTWLTPRGPRNTQTCTGIRGTNPLHWSGDRKDVQAFQATFIEEMGGTGLTQRELDSLAAFIDSLRLPPNPAGRSLAAAIKRGKVIFTSKKTRCASCHVPPRYTDNLLHDVGTGRGRLEKFGSKFDTASLLGIYRTPPYLHDGSARNLKEVLTIKNPRDQHGTTSHLTKAELDDLIHFLRALPFGP